MHAGLPMCDPGRGQVVQVQVQTTGIQSQYPGIGFGRGSEYKKLNLERYRSSHWSEPTYQWIKGGHPNILDVTMNGYSWLIDIDFSEIQDHMSFDRNFRGHIMPKTD